MDAAHPTTQMPVLRDTRVSSSSDLGLDETLACQCGNLALTFVHPSYSEGEVSFDRLFGNLEMHIRWYFALFRVWTGVENHLGKLFHWFKYCSQIRQPWSVSCHKAFNYLMIPSKKIAPKRLLLIKNISKNLWKIEFKNKFILVHKRDWNLSYLYTVIYYPLLSFCLYIGARVLCWFLSIHLYTAVQSINVISEPWRGTAKYVQWKQVQRQQ